MIEPFYKSEHKNFYLLKGDTFDLLENFEHKFDMVFADPPYFLSNGGLTIQNGEVVSVNKGDWDKSEGFEYVNEFNRKWLYLVREKMKENATIWISGTMHNIFSVGQILTELGFKILNIITWEKTNPPPNFSCKSFTHSTEHIIWARKSEKVSHYFNYELMKQLNDDKQMKDVWQLPAISSWEKSCGKHPTQKPLSLLTRIILASTKPNAWILDPFAGSSTTGIAANLANRRFLGIDKEEEFLKMSKNRKIEIQNIETATFYQNKIAGFIHKKQFTDYLKTENTQQENKVVLGFCRKKDVDNLKNLNTFYFHAIENQNVVKDFPIGLADAKTVFIYTVDKGKAISLTGYSASIKDISLKHKSTIKGKENSTTEFYYEIILNENFVKNNDLEFKIDSKKLFPNKEDKNKKLLAQFLPALTTLDNLINSKN